ncbi:MAG: Mur ligase family protein [Acidimicrobiales bacterium]
MTLRDRWRRPRRPWHRGTSGQAKILVVEADESDGTFVELDSAGIIVTNVEADHLEYYGSFDKLEETFVRFVRNAAGPKVICIDDPGAAKLSAACASDDLITYGTRPGATWRIIEPLPTPVGISFSGLRTATIR